jgi:hypothetical protein
VVGEHRAGVAQQEGVPALRQLEFGDQLVEPAQLDGSKQHGLECAVGIAHRVAEHHARFARNAPCDEFARSDALAALGFRNQLRSVTDTRVCPGLALQNTVPSGRAAPRLAKSSIDCSRRWARPEQSWGSSDCRLSARAMIWKVWRMLPRAASSVSRAAVSMRDTSFRGPQWHLTPFAVVEKGHQEDGEAGHSDDTPQAQVQGRVYARA